MVRTGDAPLPDERTPRGCHHALGLIDVNCVSPQGRDRMQRCAVGVFPAPRAVTSRGNRRVYARATGTGLGAGPRWWLNTPGTRCQRAPRTRATLHASSFSSLRSEWTCHLPGEPSGVGSLRASLPHPPPPPETTALTGDAACRPFGRQSGDRVCLDPCGTTWDNDTEGRTIRTPGWPGTLRRWSSWHRPPRPPPSGDCFSEQLGVPGRQCVRLSPLGSN